MVISDAFDDVVKRNHCCYADQVLEHPAATGEKIKVEMRDHRYEKPTRFERPHLKAGTAHDPRDGRLTFPSLDEKDVKKLPQKY